jgi:adenylylsulfate kinase
MINATAYRELLQAGNGDSPEHELSAGAGMVVDTLTAAAADGPAQSAEKSSLATWQGLTIWLTGLSGSGKTTIGNAVATELLSHGFRVEVIDGDVIRNHLCKDLGFSQQDRSENIRRIAFIAHLLTRNGIVVLVAAISPYREAREEARRTIGEFLEVYVDAPLSVCELRDPKQLYRKARSGEIRGFTGIDDPYEPPLHPEVVCYTEHESVPQSASKVLEAALSHLCSKAPGQPTQAKAANSAAS